MFRTIIIDDEQDCRETLRTYLTSLFDDIEIVAEGDGVEKGYSIIQKHKPELVFLDIQLIDGSGFDLLKRIRNIDFSLIFVTAYDEYAIRAFNFSALDYILKPIDPDLLVQAVEKFRNKKDAESLQKRIFNLLSSQKTIEKIALPSMEGYFFVKIDNIIRCESDGSYTKFFFLSGDSIMVSRSLKEYDEVLSFQGFCRVHQSHLINLKYVKQYRKGEGGVVILEDNSEIDVARRRKDDFLKAMKSFNY